MLLPSMLTTETPVVEPPQEPLGTYEVTFVPSIRAESELDGWHEPCGTASRVLKLSVLASALAKTRALRSGPTVASPVGINHALYSDPAFGVTENGAN